jgi:cation transport ATPase
MTSMADDPEQAREQYLVEAERAQRQAEEEARWIERQAEEPEQQREWLRQNSLIYGGLIGIGLILVQPFLTATSLDLSAKICVVAFSVAIPMLAGLILLNSEETFRRRYANSRSVRAAQSIALGGAFTGVVAGFWHILWFAGVGILVSGFVAMFVHSAGYLRLVRDSRTAPASAEPESEPQPPTDPNA